MMAQRIPHNPYVLADFCQAHQIKRLALFGSILRNDFNDDSDIDVLVEFETTSRVGYFDLAEIEIELGELLGTHRRIDLRTKAELSRYFRDEVTELAEVLYDSAA